MRRALLLVGALALASCHAQGCPPKTAQTAAACKLAMIEGRASKADCEKLIEESCP